MGIIIYDMPVLSVIDDDYYWKSDWLVNQTLYCCGQIDKRVLPDDILEKSFYFV